MKTVVLFITLLLNALSCGFFFAWSVSVILGTQKVSDTSYLETMQQINREILNPIFFVVFFGSLLALVLHAGLHVDQRAVFGWVLAATIIYLVGVFGVTAFGNVPLNNALDAFPIALTDEAGRHRFRMDYEGLWNRFHLIRTLSGLVSFLLLLVSLFIKS